MRFTIQKKILIGFGVVIALMVATNAYVIIQMQRVTTSTTETFSYDVRGIDIAKQMQEVLFVEEPYAEKAVAFRDEAYYQGFEEQSKLFDMLVDSLFTTRLSPSAHASVQRIRETHAWFADATRKATFGTARQGEAAFNEAARSDSLDALHAEVRDFIDSSDAAVKKSMTAAGDRMVKSTSVAYLLAVCAVLVAIGSGLFIARAITKPIGVLIKGAEKIATGQFTPVEVTTRDEMSLLANALNEMSAKLDSIDRMKTEMMHHISHELRTPLQAMTSALNLLADQRYGTLNSEQLRLTSFLREGINKITSFSLQFLDISRIESGAMKYTFTPVDLLSAMLPVIEEAKLIATRKNIAVTVNAVPIPKVRADLEKLPQIYSNLLSNAIKYTPENGRIQIDIGASKFGVRVAVTDSGIGIAPEDLPNVFTKFYQARNADKASSRGTGVGLALVKALVEAHGGRVFAESAVGEGTRFTVELPAIKEPVLPSFTAIQQSVN